MTVPRSASLRIGERAQLDLFRSVPGDLAPRDAQDLMTWPFFSLAKSKRITPIDFRMGETWISVEAVPEHGMATIWDADVLIWAASQIVEARDAGRPTSRLMATTPHEILSYVGRGTGRDNYDRLKAALDRLQSTTVATSIRQQHQRRRHRFSWINEWQERLDASGRPLGIELVLPDWFYAGVLDRALVLTIDRAYFDLTGGLERWLYRLVRKHGGRQSGGWSFDVKHLHLKSGALSPLKRFAFELRAIVRRQPLPGYLKRDGVTRDGRDAELFDARSDHADGDAFAERCQDDRHHFRFIVSPENAGDMADLRAFTRELMDDMARDLGTDLDWVAVDHWNTDNPHIHVLVRGRVDDGSDLVIDGEYIQDGVRGRAEERATLELGPRSEHDIRAALQREVDADRWTSLDQQLKERADTLTGTVDLRPGGDDEETRRLLCGRVDKLERLGLAQEQASGLWTIGADAEQTLRDLSARTDIIKTMHRAMSQDGHTPDVGAFALHGATPSDPIVGRLVERGLHDELEGTAYAVIDGADGRTHHVRFDDLDMTGDARPGAIVELRSWDDASGNARLSLATRSDLPLDRQVTASGATWLDRQLIARDPVATGNGFGTEIRDAMEARSRELEAAGLARRQGGEYRFERNLIETLRSREISEATDAIAQRSRLAHRPSTEGDYVSGVYRERITLASGRFAMIDDGMGFQLVPWRPALDPHLGNHISGTMGRGGVVDWSLGRGRGLGL